MMNYPNSSSIPTPNIASMNTSKPLPMNQQHQSTNDNVYPDNMNNTNSMPYHTC